MPSAASSRYLGFALLALLLLTTTSIAYARIRRGDVVAHREWMIRSYALIFAAVTLRIELPILVALFGAFRPAYVTIAWLSWVPNLLWATLYVRVTRRANFAASMPPSRVRPSAA